MTTATFCAAGGPSLPVSPARLFVADHERVATTEFQNQLEQLGYAVTGVTGEAGQVVQACKSARPDLAIIDLELTMSNGASVAKIISDLGIPVITISTTGSDDDVETTCEFGGFGMLVKPIADVQLGATIRIAWGRAVAAYELSAEIDRVNQRLEDRKIIEQAKWALVQRLSISEPEALRQLQRRARNSRRTLTAVARSILDTTEVFDAARAG